MKSAFERLEATYADEHFDCEMEKIAKDVKSKVEYLREKGYLKLLLKTLGDDFIGNIAHAILPPSLSELIVTENFNLLLPGYNNKEIKMSPLPKAVYLLFLRHPEGIRFKMLPEYKEELLNIYKYISASTSTERMEQSVELVTDPSKNAINEKCSRIREAFLLHFEESLSHYYYITGSRGLKKRIDLPSNLVKLPLVLESIPRTVVVDDSLF